MYKAVTEEVPDASWAVSEQPSINLEVLTVRTDLALRRLGNLLDKIILTDRSIAIGEINQLYDRAGDTYDEAIVIKAAGNTQRAEQLLFTVLFIAEEGLDGVSKILMTDFRQRFDRVKNHFAANPVDEWAKFKLECARHLIGRFGSGTAWDKSRSSLRIIDLLIEGHAIATHNERNARHEAAPTPSAHAWSGTQTDTHRWIAV